ncbi:6414_t:CDS:2, partial [Scutellospora calospora]
VYVNRHKRPDVVAYHQIFLEKIAQLDQLISKWLDQDCRIRTFPQLNDDEKEHVWVTHNEKLGPSMHISDFLTETIEPLKDDQEEARVMMVLGCVGLFAFNNVTSHMAFVEDALVASKMNLSSGGSAPKMRDTIWNNNHQSMIIEEDYFIYDKKKKKILIYVVNLKQDRLVLECALCKKKEADLDNINCYVRQLMAHQPDFLAERGQIQKEIESKGHKIIFYHKFHPEFNYIEMY